MIATLLQKPAADAGAALRPAMARLSAAVATPAAAVRAAPAAGPPSPMPPAHGFSHQFSLHLAGAVFAALIFTILWMWGRRGRRKAFLDTAAAALAGLARRRALAVVCVGALAFGGSAVVGLIHPHVPWVHDEFAYLLQADTFASGRLANPPNPHWQFFDTFHVIQRPTYAAQYPPMQAVLLAIGQKLTGNPAAGVWLSSGLACGAICWMLQAFVGEIWALYVSLLAVAQFGIIGYWAQSYYGGFAAVLGAALALGSVKRLLDRPQPRTAATMLLLGLGIAMVGSSRPYEGLLFSLPLFVVISSWLLARGRAGGWRAAARAALPCLAVLGAAGAMTAFYNFRVTGSATTLPFFVYTEHHEPVPPFLFQSPPAHGPILTPEIRTFYQAHSLVLYHEQHTVAGVLRGELERIRQLWAFLLNVVLSLPFIFLAWRERPRVRPWLIACAAWWLDLELRIPRWGARISELTWPLLDSPTPWIVATVLAIVLLMRHWNRLALACCASVLAGLSVETWQNPHYAAPLLPALLVLVAEGCRRVAEERFLPARQAMGSGLSVGASPASALVSTAFETESAASPRLRLQSASFAHAGLVLMRTLPLAAAALLSLRLLAPALNLQAVEPGLDFYMSPTPSWAVQRERIARALALQPPRDLIFVHYAADHPFLAEWVENRADLNAAKVVWAHDLGAAADRALLTSFPGHRAFLICADETNPQLRPLGSSCR
jgi:hypothetical protein